MRETYFFWQKINKKKIFGICEPLARCAKRGSSLPLGTPMEIDFTSAYLHYPLPQCSKIVTPIIFSISYELFRLPSAKVPQDYQLLRTLVWCLREKLTRNNWPFLDTLATKLLTSEVPCNFLISNSTFWANDKKLLNNYRRQSSSCEMIILRHMSHGEIMGVCMGIFTTALRNTCLRSKPRNGWRAIRSK